MLGHARLVFKHIVFDLLGQNTSLSDSMLTFGGVADEPRTLSEEFLHHLQGRLFRLWKRGPEEDRIGEVADLEIRILAASETFVDYRTRNLKTRRAGCWLLTTTRR